MYSAAIARFPWLEWTGDFRLAYLPSDGGLAPLAWIVLCRSSTGPERPEVYVDAHAGEIAGTRDTMRYADANVYDPNPVADPTGPHRVTLPNLTSTTRLEGTYARSASCNPGTGWDYCSSTTRYASPDVSGHYLYSPTEPSTTDPFSEVMGYYHLDKINDFMGDTYGVNMMCNGHRWIAAMMNMNMDNAMYGDADEDGCADVTIGQGTHDFGYDAAVIYHEFGHGLNRTQVDFEYWDFDGLGPDWSASGLDEGSADYWAASMSGRPVVGEYASTGTTPGELGFRDLSEFVTCPQGLYGESHYDSPIWSTTLWQIRSTLGQFKTDSLLFDALASMASTADFSSAGSALISAANALEPGVLTAADVTQVETAVADHTLVGCIRVVPLGDEDSHIFIATGYGGYDVPSGVQFSVTTPENTTRLTVRFDQLTVGGGYTVFMNRGAPVHFTRSGWDLTIDDYDYEYSGSPANVSYTGWSDPLIEPGTTYYFTYMHNSDAMMLGVSVDIIVTPVPDSTTDTIEDTTPDTIEDTVADVPADTVGDTITDTPAEPDPAPDTSEDTVVDTGTDPGTITESGGCGCSIAS